MQIMTDEGWPKPTELDIALIKVAAVLLGLAAIGGVILAVGS